MKNLGEVYQVSSYPLSVVDSEITQFDIQENAHFERCKGVKTFFFELIHKDGDI